MTTFPPKFFYRYRRIIISILSLFAVLATLFFVRTAIGLYQTLPGMSELREIRHHQSSRVLSSDGELLGSYFFQNRTQIELDDVSPVFTDALVAIEDIRFYEHKGLDWRAFVRVLVKSIILGQDSGGGSTLTQQLAKNLYPRQSGGIFNLTSDKLREIITAHRLERLYSKSDILELYLNTVSFGEETFGIETASNRFFSKPTSELELHEAALLAGVLKAPGYYNPHRHPERALARRNTVIRQMEKYGKISPEKADHYLNKPVSLDYNRITVDEGPAPHFREHLRAELQYILRDLPALDGASYNIYTDGLIIRTTIDSRIQSAAEEALTARMKQLQDTFETQSKDTLLLGRNDPAILAAWERSPHFQQLVTSGYTEEQIDEVFHTPRPVELYTWEGNIDREVSPHDSLRHYLSFLNAGFMAMSPHSGEVRAWVGGINHKYFQYDHVKSKRQAGSAFKPVVYATALEAGMEPCDYRRNLLSRYEAYEEWTPRNISDEYGGYYSMQAALSNSVNTIAVDLLMDTGIGNVQQNAGRMGITSPVPAEPSIALGTADVSLLELTQAYSTFASGGLRRQPHYIEAIYDSKGRLLYQFSNPNLSKSEEVFSPEIAAAMISMLSKAVDEGTGFGLRSQFGISHALAGKTGTTQGYTDGWFIGMTPDLVFGTWVGGLSPRIRFSETMGYASRTALPIAGRFLQNLEKDTTLAPQPAAFHDFQTAMHLNTSCPDYRDDSALDRFRDFMTGRSTDKPRRVQQENESGNLIDRVRGFFRRD